MINFPQSVKDDLLDLGSRNVYLEGNILKLINAGEDEAFVRYIEAAKQKDKENREKRLGVTKQVQTQNKELQEKADENDRLMAELKEALSAAEEAKQNAVNDLDLLQKKSQFELIGNIVQIALWVIVGVGIIVTGMYLFAMGTGSNETTLIGNTWSNLFGILLTNSFSIIGTIMGVKYASEQGKTKNE